MSVSNALLVLVAAKAGISLVSRLTIRPNRLRKEIIKYSDISNIKLLDLPVEAYEDEANDELIKENPLYEKELKEFCTVLTKKVSRQYLDNFYRNFKTLKEMEANPVKRIIRAYSESGAYNLIDNAICFETNLLSKYLNSKNHELMHAASTYYDKENGVIYSGLTQIYLDKEHIGNSRMHGVFIDEGVSQFFANKYFDPISLLPAAHTILSDEQKVASALYEILGSDKLKYYYFRGDLKGFNEALSNYVPIEDVYKFINYTDLLFEYREDRNLHFKELTEVKRFINNFLIEAYSKSRDIKNTDIQSIAFKSRCCPFKVKTLK